MSNVCIVASCNTRKNTDKASAIKCFSFPKDPDLKRQWLNLCQVEEDHNKKVCIKHFKENDFVDGLKARLMSVQPTRLKKDAIPSLFLSPDVPEQNKQKQIQNQEEMLRKYVIKKKKQVRISPAKGTKVKTSNHSKSSMEYLSKLVPIAPKGVGMKRATIVSTKNQVVTPKNGTIAPKDRIIVPKQPMLAPKPSLAPKYQKIALKEYIIPSEEPPKLPTGQNKTLSLSNNLTTSLNPISNITPLKTLILQSDTNKKQNHESTEYPIVNHTQSYSMHQFKILQHDNSIYKKRINTLVDNQNKLLARIKDLEAMVESQKEDYVDKVKETFANVLTSNQIDHVLGKKKHIWWTNEEYSKALKLLHISKQGYNYMRENLNYPLPCITNVYKWSSKHELTKKSDENKENSGKVIDDQVMIDDDQIKLDDVKLEIKSEYTDEDKKIVDIEYDQHLDDKKYTIKIDDIEHVKVDYDDDHVDHCNNDDNNDEKYNSNEINHLKVTLECSDQDKIEIDHVIDDHDIIMNSDQNDEFYEELVIDNDYSDYDEIYDNIQTVEYIEKDNG